jgi:hypothetical protein
MITDKIIEEKFSRKESRELLYLCKKYPYINYFILLKYLKESNKISFNKFLKERILISKRIHELYIKFFNEEEYRIHWNISYHNQIEKSKKYDYMIPPERKDNKTYLNRGTGNMNGGFSSVRFPKKGRKTAWKRFYKLFPNLKP